MSDDTLFVIVRRTREYKELDGQHGAAEVLCRQCGRRLVNWPGFLHRCSLQGRMEI